MINLNELRDKAYKCACDHGFHDVKCSNEHYLMLIITEVSEAVEADRKDKHADKRGFESDNEFQSDYMPEAFIDNFETFIKDSIEDELADAVIRLLDFSAVKKLPPFNEMLLKLKYAVFDYNKSFAEIIFNVVSQISFRGEHPNYEEIVSNTICHIFMIAKAYDIDLDWYIEQKMKYNELRPHKNGKRY